MAKIPSRFEINFDFNAWFADAQKQFQNLNPQEPGQWPILPKVAVFVASAAAVILLGYVLVLSSVGDELDLLRNKETGLKQEYVDKVGQAVNLPELRKQRIQVQEYVTQLEKQLPGKAEMDALLSDINQAGIGRGLNFELFKPGAVVIKDYYAELPIAVRVSGRYHDFGAFAGDIANLSRIVTLHDMQISSTLKATGTGATATVAPGDLVMEATARTYRYLDPAEVEESRAARQKDMTKGGKGGKGGKGTKAQKGGKA